MASRAHVKISGVDRVLAHFQKGAIKRRMAQKVITAGLVPISRAIRRQVTASNAPADVKRAARKTVGRKVRLPRGNKPTVAKTGFGVGKQKVPARNDDRPGVGLSKQNIHWAVLGTRQRRIKTTDAASGGPAAGHPTGRMPAFLAGIVPLALTASQAEATARMEQKLHQELEKEIRRAR